MSKAESNGRQHSRTGRLTATNHAQLRYLERVDATEQFPRRAIRRRYQSGDRVDHADIEADGLTPISDGEVVLAVDERSFTVVSLWRIDQ